MMPPALGGGGRSQRARRECQWARIRRIRRRAARGTPTTQNGSRRPTESPRCGSEQRARDAADRATPGPSRYVSLRRSLSESLAATSASGWPGPTRDRGSQAAEPLAGRLGTAGGTRTRAAAKLGPSVARTEDGSGGHRESESLRRTGRQSERAGPGRDSDRGRRVPRSRRRVARPRPRAAWHDLRREGPARH